MRLLNGLQAIWSLPEGASTNEELTVEKVMEIGTEYSHILLRNLSVAEIDDYINPAYKQYRLAQGNNQRTREIVLAMATRKIDIETIADVTGLSVAEVQALLGDAKQHKTT